MIKIKDIIKEHKIIVTESFKAGKLRALVGNQWSGLDSTFWSYGAKLGIQWDKIKDTEIETNAKPKKKGIEIAYIDKDVTVPMKGKQSNYYGNSNIGFLALLRMTRSLNLNLSNHLSMHEVYLI